MVREFVSAPPLHLQALEPFAALELGALLAGSPWLAVAPRGDGSAVLVIPAFAGTDRSTDTLRQALRWKGHSVHGWGLGRNLGPHRQVVAAMRRRLDDLHRMSGRTVTIVGVSLGGVYARELARTAPASVRQVITLGSPFRLRTGDRTSASWLYDIVGPRHDHVFTLPPPEDARPPLPAPATAIYTRTDGVVRWQACIDRESARHENVEVRGTHTGLGFNVAAVYAVLDRAALADGEWRRFRPPPMLRHLYGPAHRNDG